MPNAAVRAAAIGLPTRQPVPAGMRRRMENAIERLIAALDAIDGDPDLEPWLGSVEGKIALDAEDEHDGCEPDGDDEPTIGWSESESESGYIRPCGLDTEDHEPTARETFGKGFPADPRGDDEEDGHDAEGNDPDNEHSLGWSVGESLTGNINATDRYRQEVFG